MDVAVAIAAQVGDDEFGPAAPANLEANGVSIDLVVRGAEPTGCAFINVEESGENAITVASGADGVLTAAAAAPHEFRPGDILVPQGDHEQGCVIHVADA